MTLSNGSSEAKILQPAGACFLSEGMHGKNEQVNEGRGLAGHPRVHCQLPRWPKFLVCL